MADLSIALEQSFLSEYTAPESDIEIEYESSFIDEEEEEEAGNEGKATPEQMIQTLSFDAASRLPDMATVTAPDDRVAAPEEAASEVTEDLEPGLEESVMSELDQVLQDSVAEEEGADGSQGQRDGAVSEQSTLLTTVKPLSRSQDSSPRVNPKVLEASGFMCTTFAQSGIFSSSPQVR